LTLRLPAEPEPLSRLIAGGVVVHVEFGVEIGCIPKRLGPFSPPKVPWPFWMTPAWQWQLAAFD